MISENENIPVAEEKAATTTENETGLDSDALSDEELAPSIFACSYCRINDPSCLIRCRNCNRWFCNNKTSYYASHFVAHLLNSKHIAGALHGNSIFKETVLQCHFNEDCEDNLFLLNLVFVTTPAEKNQLFMLSCRKHLESMKERLPEIFRRYEVCDKEPRLVESPQSLINNKQVSELVAPKSTTNLLEDCIKITDLQIDALERAWQDKKPLQIEDIERGSLFIKPLTAKTVYDNPKDYSMVYLSLLKCEMEFDRRQKALLDLENLKIEFFKNREIAGYNYLANIKLQGLGGDRKVAEILKGKIRQGDEVILYPQTSSFLPSQEMGIEKKGEKLKKFQEGFKANILRFKSNELLIKLVSSVKPPSNKLFKMEFSWKQTSFERMKIALKSFSAKMCTEPAIERAILGDLTLVKKINSLFFSSKDKNYSITPTEIQSVNFPQLNASQKEALLISMNQPLTAVQGPPGTGKTTLSANIILNFWRRAASFNRRLRGKGKGSKSKKKFERVLVCAPSNIAVDHLVEKLELAGIPALRIYAKNKEMVSRNSVDVEKVMHLKVASKLLRTLKREKHLLSSFSKTYNQFKSGKMPSKKMDKYRILEELNVLYLKAKRNQQMNNPKHPSLVEEFVDQLAATSCVPLIMHILKVEKKFLTEAIVVCCTCITAGKRAFNGLKFSYVLMDECSQATEPECLVPLLKGARQVVLVGDHYQLGPVVMDRFAAKAGLKQSLFERFVKIGLVPSVLRVQYRMHPKLAEYPSKAFYSGSLESDGSTLKRKQQFLSDFFPDPNCPALFLASFEKEELAPNGTSYFNRAEATNTIALVKKLLGRKFSLEGIGIITPYDAQKSYMLDELSRFLRPGDLDKIEVASVDAFQGREKDVILISCVRSNDYDNIGFLNDYRRLNVAITRAKFGYVILGNPKVLVSNPLWESYLGFFELQNLVFSAKGDQLERVKQRFTRFEKLEDIYEGVEKQMNLKRFDSKGNKGFKNYYKMDNKYEKEEIEETVKKMEIETQKDSEMEIEEEKSDEELLFGDEAEEKEKSCSATDIGDSQGNISSTWDEESENEKLKVKY